MFRLRPSGSFIWTNCAAAVRFGENHPEPPDTDPSRQGTAAAWVAEMVLNNHVFMCQDLVGETHENGWLIDSVMAKIVQRYCDTVRQRGGVVRAETFVTLTDTIAGTSDSSATIMGRELFVDDLKYGYGPVEAEGNTQLIIYGAATLMNTNAPIERVHLSIYQPRAQHRKGPHRTWTLTPDQLRSNADWIIQRGHEAQKLDSVATPGKHCKYCKARTSCVALKKSLYDNHEYISSASQYHIPAADIHNEIEFLRELSVMVEARKDAIEAEAEIHIGEGTFVKGWHIGKRYGRKKVTKKPETVEALTGVDPYKKVLRTPKELIEAGASHEAVNAVSETPIIGHKLEEVTEDFFANQFKRNT